LDQKHEVTMALPFTSEQFLDIFRQYNTAIWPLQCLLTATALVAVVFAVRGRSGKVVAFCLAGQWVWTGIVYHWLFFAKINPAAWLFGALWVAGGVAFAWNVLGSRVLSFRTTQRARLVIGWSLVAYALVLCPILGRLGGRIYPFAPTYGAPCPVAIATLGLLWFARPPFPRYLVIAPVIWAAIGSAAAFTLGVREDLGLLVAGLSGVVLLLPGVGHHAIGAP
jgi:Family of unknown function (DUF6064)